MLELVTNASRVSHSWQQPPEGSPFRWLDAQGGSLIRTLGKAWGDEAPAGLMQILRMLVARRGQAGPQQRAAAAESCALAVAHLLPALLRCGPIR